MIKILHVFFAKSKVSSGILKQLSFEVDAAIELKNCVWETKYWLPGNYNKGYINEFENNFIDIIINNIRFYFWLNKISKNYDYIIIRYPTYDPFSFLFYPKCKYLTIHHSKESIENTFFRYKVIKKLIEKYITRKLITNSVGVVGVTNEIALATLNKTIKNKKKFVLPNGVDFNTINISEKIESTEGKYINLLFVASSSSPWHGLDRIIEGVKNDKRFKLIIIGSNNDDAQFFENDRIDFLGYKSTKRINEIANYCHIALGSFGMDRNNLTESTTLKVREYLAMGLPVYSGIKDSSLPVDFPFYSFTFHNFDSCYLFNFFNSTKNSSRKEIRQLSEKYISKYIVMDAFISKLNKVM